MRQGTGVYYYAGNDGGIYIGEWLRGKMNGHGMMMYPDGEYYIGRWKYDQKEGHGVCLRAMHDLVLNVVMSNQCVCVVIALLVLALIVSFT